MQIEVLKSKIHRVTITEANLNYVGSITIDEELMEAANLIEGERVQIWNVTNGERLDTYVIRGRRGSGAICLNGAAAPQGAGGRRAHHRLLRPHGVRGGEDVPPVGGLSRHGDQPSGRVE